VLACLPACSKERLTEIAQESDRLRSTEGLVNPEKEDLALNPSCQQGFAVGLQVAL
jgi:hypothetical protein